jgi:hypothetical protein
LKEIPVQSVVGIFNSRRAAEEAVSGLNAIGLADNSVVFATPENAPQALESVPTTDAESPGIGKAISGYVGGVVGGGVGMGVGSGVASLLVPGVGVIFAAGIAAGALLGVSGAAIGAALGKETEKTLDTGVPHDDVFFYRDLLRQGRSLVVASTETDELAIAARAVLHQHGSEDVETVRKEWASGRSHRAA